MTDRSGSSGGIGILPGIQMMRGIAAVTVVITHANLMMAYPQYFGSSPFAIRDAGQFGVAIFFVISGFIIAIVSLREDLSPRLSRMDYARRRFVRIVPFLWVGVVGYNFVSLIGTHTVEWWPMLRTLVVWPVGSLKPNVVWSLRHEFLFYALFALLMLGKRRWTWLLILWFAAPLICWPLLYLTHYPIPALVPEHLTAWEELFHVVLLGSNSGANLQLGAGFGLGWLTITGNALVARRISGLSWALLAAVVATAIADVTALPPGLGRAVLWTVLATPPVWLAIISTASNGWLVRIGNALGNASFAVYLVHNGVLLVLFELANHFRAALPESVFFVLFVLGALAVGLVAHHLIEKPLIALLAHGRPVAPWLRLRRSGQR